MKKVDMLKILAVMVMLFTTLPFTRAASIDIPDFEIDAGGSYTTSVSIDPGTAEMFNYKGLQFDLAIPAGLTVNLEKTSLEPPLEGFTLRSSQLPTGEFRFMVYTDGDPVSYTSDLLTLTFEADENATRGKRTVNITGGVLSTPLGQDRYLDDSSFVVDIFVPDVRGVYIYLPDFTLTLGGSRDVPVNIMCTNPQMFDYQGFQFDLFVPEYVTLSNPVLTDVLAGYTLRTNTYEPGHYRFVVYTDGNPVNFTEGLMMMTFTADTDAPAGDYLMDTQRQIFSSPYGQDIRVVNSSTTITILDEMLSLTLDRHELELMPGESYMLTATVTPEEMADLPIVWTSSNPAVATVDQQGNVTAVAPGTAVITATCGDASDSCVVTVPEPAPLFIYIPDFEIEQGATYTVPVTVDHGDDPMPEFKGYQFDITVPDGIIIREGALTTSIPGFSVTFSRLGANSYRILGARTNGSSTSDELLQLAFEAEQYATTGTFVMTVTDGVISAPNGSEIEMVESQSYVTITEKTVEPQYSITLNKDEIELKVGESETLYPTELIPSADDMPDLTVVWSSSDETVATVDQQGNVTAVAPGTATITATWGTASAVCVVTVEPEEIIPAEEILLNAYDVNIHVGDTYQMIATVLPENTTDKTVVWSIADSSIASVTMEGLLTAVAVGQTTLTATCGTASATCRVTVFEDNVPVLSVVPANLELYVGDTGTVTAVLDPEPETPWSVTWTSEYPDFATVDQDGVVTALAVGVTDIIAEWEGQTAMCHVSVIERTVPPVPVEQILLNAYDKNLRVGETFQMEATVMPENATEQNVTWSIADPAIASITETGFITALSQGQTTVTAFCGGVSANCTLTVYAEDEVMLQVTPNVLDLYVDDSYTLTATITPAAADGVERIVTWTSNDPTVATVDQNGKVTGVAPGVADIQAEWDGHTGYCHVTVSERPMPPVPVESIELNTYDQTLYVDDTFQMTATVIPANATEQNVTWTSADPMIATISETGLVTAVAVGSTVITAECGGVTAECVITVIERTTPPVPVERIELNTYDQTLYVDDTFQMEATVIPANADNQQVRWTTSNPAVAQISETGLITARAIGRATITAICDGVTAECIVTVINRPATPHYSIYVPDFTIYTSETYTVPVTIEHGAFDMPEYKGFNFDLTVPAGISIDAVAVSSSLAGFSLSYNEVSDGTYRILAMRTSSATTAEDILDITFSAAADAAAGTYPMTVTRAVLSAPDGSDIMVDDSQSEVTIVETQTPPTLTITVDPTTMTLAEGASGEVVATVSPAEMAGKTVTWTTSDATIATVVSTVNGKATVTGVKAGTATITAYCEGASAVCVVTVVQEGPDNPFTPDDINVTLSEQNFIVESGTVVEMWARAEGGNPSGWTYDWTLRGSEGTLSQTGDLTITAYNDNDQPLTQIYELHLVNAWNTEVMFDATYLFTVEIWRKAEADKTPDFSGWYGNGEGTFVSDLKIREGNKLGMRVNDPVGGYMNEWEFLWKDQDDATIGTEQEIWVAAELFGAAANSGDNQAISTNVYDVTITNYGPDGDVWFESTMPTPKVEVYKRPQIPTQLLRKGDGTSSTFVVMMTPLNNQQILDLGYYYVYGYTDRNGQMHEMETTELRYCHTTDEIYNDPNLTFWAYSFWTYADGSVVTSGLRYLDGSEDADFDASTFDGSTRSITRASDSETRIYTMEGQYVGSDYDRLEPGLYIIRTGETAVKIIKN